MNGRLTIYLGSALAVLLAILVALFGGGLWAVGFGMGFCWGLVVVALAVGPQR